MGMNVARLLVLIMAMNFVTQISMDSYLGIQTNLEDTIGQGDEVADAFSQTGQNLGNSGNIIEQTIGSSIPYGS